MTTVIAIVLGGILVALSIMTLVVLLRVVIIVRLLLLVSLVIVLLSRSGLLHGKLMGIPRLLIECLLLLLWRQRFLLV